MIPRLDSDSESRLKSNLVSASKFATVCHPQQLPCSNQTVSSQLPLQYSTRGGGGVITETTSNEHPRLDSVSESRSKSNLVSASKFTTVCHPQQLQCSNHPVSSQF